MYIACWDSIVTSREVLDGESFMLIKDRRVVYSTSAIVITVDSNCDFNATLCIH